MWNKLIYKNEATRTEIYLTEGFWGDTKAIMTRDGLSVLDFVCDGLDDARIIEFAHMDYQNIRKNCD